MATLNFDESIVLILFAQAFAKPQPSRSELLQFDADLQKTFGQKLLDVLSAEGMDANVHNRSVVLGCRQHVQGTTADAQLRNACRYVLHAQRELGSIAIAAFQALEGTIGTTAAQRAHRRPAKKSKDRGATKKGGK